MGLGLKGFSASGLPLTKTKNITGNSAKVIGMICILVGLLFFVQGAVPMAAILFSVATL